MDLKELKLFVHLAKSLHFARTSRELHMAPSSITRMVQKMEAEVGVTLFERDNRTVSLTPAGVKYRQFAIETLEAWQSLARELDSQAETLNGRISIFCSVTASYSFLHELLDQFRARYPFIEIQLHTGDSAQTIERIMDEQEDIGIAVYPDRMPDKLAFRGIKESPLVFIAPAFPCALSTLIDHSEQHPLELAWGELPLVLSETGVARSRVDKWFAMKGVRPNIYAQVAGNEAIVSMVSLGFGVGVVPELVIENSPLSAKIRILKVLPELEPFSIGLTVLKRKLSNPVVKALWDLSQEHVGSAE
ncbi:MAG: HTH-type transcriptional activator IlvY [Pseudohongiellaceae bacterium]|nr:HTH-type transcriptional activator IlvY [Pseudohongiellaceae bacterium]